MGYDNECIVNLQSLPGEYFCPVCRTLIYPNEALQAQCTHLFCRPCLTYVATTTRACPYDGYLVTEADSKPLVESSKELADTIDKVAVHCLYHRSGCQWQGTLAESTAHGTGCTYGNSPVVCNRCGTQIVHRQVQEHAQICPGVQPQAAENVAAATQATGTATSSAPTAPVPNTTAVPATVAPTVPNAATPALAPVPGAAAPTHEQWYQQQQMQYQQYYQQQYPGYDPYQQQQYAQYQQYAQPQMQAPPQPYSQPQAPNQAPQQLYMPPQQYPQPQVRPPLQPVPQPQPQPQIQPPAHAVSGYQSFPQPLPGPPPRPMHAPSSQFPPQQPPHMHPPPHMPPQQQPGMPPQQQPGMPPQQQPGMPPQQQPGMPPQQQPGMPQQQPSMPPPQQPGMPPQQPGMPPQHGYQQPAMQPHGFPQQAGRPQAPPNYPPNAPSQGMPPYQQPNQARPMLPAQGSQQQPQGPHSASPATPKLGEKRAPDTKAEGDAKNENEVREKGGSSGNDGKNVSNGDRPAKTEDKKDPSAPNSMIPNQGQVASSMHPPSQQNAFPSHGHGYPPAPHPQYPPGPPPSHQNPYGPPHIPDPRHTAPYQPPPQMPPSQMRPPAPQDSFWPPPHSGALNQSIPQPPLGGMPGHHGFPPPAQGQLPPPPHAWPAMGGPPPRALDMRGSPFIPEDRPLAKANGVASNMPDDRFRPPFMPEGFRPPHDEHFRPPLRDFNEDLKQFPRPAHLDADGPARFDNYMPSSRPGSNALTPRPSRPDSLSHAPEFGRRSPGHAGRDPDGIRRGPNDFGSTNLPRNNNFGGYPSHHDMHMGDPGYNEHFGLGPRDDDNFQHSRKRMTGSMVRCLICKIDCETLEGLEMHTQGREHQQVAMDMVMNIKKENAKKHKPSAIAIPIEDGNKAKKQGVENRGNMQ